MVYPCEVIFSQVLLFEGSFSLTYFFKNQAPAKNFSLSAFAGSDTKDEIKNKNKDTNNNFFIWFNLIIMSVDSYIYLKPYLVINIKKEVLMHPLLISLP